MPVYIADTDIYLHACGLMQNDDAEGEDRNNVRQDD